MLFFFGQVCWLRLLRNKSNLFITWSMVVVAPLHQAWTPTSWMAIPFVDLLVTPWKQLQSIKSLHSIIQVRKIKHRQTNCTIGTVNHLEAKASFHVWRCLKNMWLPPTQLLWNTINYCLTSKRQKKYKQKASNTDMVSVFVSPVDKVRIWFWFVCSQVFGGSAL